MKEIGRTQKKIYYEARTMDLDILLFNDEEINENDELKIPHYKIKERLFVLKPLLDIDYGLRFKERGEEFRVKELYDKVIEGKWCLFDLGQENIEFERVIGVVRDNLEGNCEEKEEIIINIDEIVETFQIKDVRICSLLRFMSLRS